MVSFATHFAQNTGSNQSPRAGVNAVYLGNHRVLLRTVWGHKMFVDSRDLSLSPHLILDGHWEMWISNIFRLLVQPGMQVIEVGANVGYYTLLTASLVGETGRVISVEANPHMAKFVNDNLDINGFRSRATVVEAAAYSDRRVLRFAIFRDHMASSSLYATAQSAAGVGDQVTFTEIQAMPLDDLVPPGSRVDLVKVDAEGAELHVLQGASRIIADNPDILLLLEHGPDLLREVHQSGASALFDFCAGMGMHCYLIRTDSKLQRCDFDDLMQAGHCDAVFTRRILEQG